MFVTISCANFMEERSVIDEGLEPIGNTAGNPARFMVETFSAGRGDVSVVVLNPRGVQEPVRLTSTRTHTHTHLRRLITVSQLMAN